MARQRRIEHDGAWYHVMNRGADRTPIVLDDRDRSHFVELLSAMGDADGVEIHAWCLMGNHFHLLVRTPRRGLPEALRVLTSSHALWFNRRHGRDGPLFRGRYRAELVNDDDYVLAASRYIHRNPVDAGLVIHPAAYRWSSYADYAGESAPAWLHTQFVLSLVGGSPSRYRRIVETHADDTDDVVGAVAGGGPDRRVPTDVGPLRDLVAAVVEVFGVERDDLCHSERGSTNHARIAAVGLAREVLRLDSPSIARRFGFSSETTVRYTLHRHRRLVGTNPEYRERVGVISSNQRWGA